MRTHNLLDIKIVGREKILSVEPHFDFYQIKKAHAVVIDFGQDANDESQPSLVLKTKYRGEAMTYDLTIRFEGIRELIFPEMRPFLRFTELEVEDVSERMLEGVRFEVNSYFDYSFRCLCGEIVIVSFEPCLYDRTSD
jgi:hypothetical protein